MYIHTHMYNYKKSDVVYAHTLVPFGVVFVNCIMWCVLQLHVGECRALGGKCELVLQIYAR